MQTGDGGPVFLRCFVVWWVVPETAADGPTASQTSGLIIVLTEALNVFPISLAFLDHDPFTAVGTHI